MNKKKVPSLVLMLFAYNLVFVSGAFGAEIIEIVICDEVDLDTREPLEEGSMFFNHLIDIYAWVRLSGINDGQSLRFIWSSPGGVIIDNEITASSTETDYWDRIYVKGHLPEQDFGNWSVNIYIDGAFLDSKPFEILSYDAIMAENELFRLVIDQLTESLIELNQRYNTLQQSIAPLTTEIVQLKITYDELDAEYSTMQEGYNTTKNNLQELLVEYGNIQGNYTALFPEYESLNEELSSTKKHLNNTRTLLYGSSGLALVLLLVSAYLVNKERGS